MKVEKASENAFTDMSSDDSSKLMPYEDPISRFEYAMVHGFERGVRHDHAERSLMLAVLQDAISCIQAGLTKPCPRNEKLLLETREWIYADEDSVFSFTNVCETAGFDPRALRVELKRWEAKLLEARIKEIKRPVLKQSKCAGNKKSMAQGSCLSPKIRGRIAQKTI